MARLSSSDRRWLELKDGKWRVSVAVPRRLHGKLGTRLKAPLNTDSLAVANRLKWPVVAEFKQRIAEAGGTKGKDVLTTEALALAAYRRTVSDPSELEILSDTIAERAAQLAGPYTAVETDPNTGEPIYLHDPARERKALAYVALATGKATPLDAHHEAYLAQQHTKARTKADDARAIQFLQTWCERERISPTVEAITRKEATRFADSLASIAGGRGAVTLNKYIGRLSRYWQWMEHREHVTTNVWHGVKISSPPTPHDEVERAFSNDEMQRLLGGHTTPAMHDLMRIAALSGARLDAIVDLKVGDCADGLFVFKPQKKEPAPRAVPIHSALTEIVRRRTEGKEAGDSLFPEWPAPRKAGSMRERSFKASNAFTAYRRTVGVDAVVAGKRRSLVNFHSFRRWFITMAERADQPESIIAVVVGHKRTGMTLGRYSAGPLMEQARRCVEAVKLP
ncbi:tyrosine-type recombinase/integrase [Xanthobacter sp. DSM 24535]|uniref:tyrosine-type recombinase/integrase n=1 Tax=Roseixanthobacter psychrophilus TaxID=3119917 RepID=UPI00372AF5E3